MSEMKPTTHEVIIDAMAASLSRIPCAGCNSENKTVGCHKPAETAFYQTEAKKIYHEFMEPLYQTIKMRRILNWILFACICLLLLCIPREDYHHHVLERYLLLTKHAIQNLIPTIKKDIEIATSANAASHQDAPASLLEANDLLSDAPLGIVNNNPLNVKGKDWAGQTGNDSQGHAIFSHPYYGLRAGAKTLKKYQEEGIDTIQAIVNKWSTKNREAYVDFLSKRLNIPPDKKIDVLALLPWLIEAMVVFEVGHQPYPPATYALLGIHSDIQKGGL